jgi:hypothetical protein
VTTVTNEVEVKEGPAEPPETQPEAPRAPEPASKKRGLFGRVIDWFWCGSAFAALRESRRLPSARALELGRRAHAAMELGRAALEPAQSFAHGPVDALACDLYSQSIYWTLRAKRSLTEPDSSASAAEALEPLWNSADREAFERAAGDSEAAEALRRAVVGRSFVDFAELAPDEQARLARSLRPFAESLIESIDNAQLELERLWLKRLLRLALPVVALALVVGGSLFAVERAEQAKDVLRGKPWVASSRWPEGGCTSPAQECAGSPMYFFATGEEDSPWIEFDLGSPQGVSGFRIVNRKDCCQERAVPLVIEVSLDHSKWTEVARKTDEFRSWKGSFPSTPARWVRLKVPRRSFLHLAAVRLFR